MDSAQKNMDNCVFNQTKYVVTPKDKANKKGYLAPYKGEDIRYHIPQFRQRQSNGSRYPRNAKEHFNYVHSSLRNVIERTFGVWKARFLILKDFHANFSFETQIDIIIASMTIHNYIRLKGQDMAFNVAEQESYDPSSDFGEEERCETNAYQSSASRVVPSDQYMNNFRDEIAQQIHSQRSR